jgi:superfamily I DNA/RNA helicase
MDDLDEGQDPLNGYRSLVKGHPPVLKGFDSEQAENEWVAEEIKRLIDDGLRAQDICVVGRTARQYKGIADELQKHGQDTYVIKRDTAENTQNPGVRFANMHRVKGLEFRVVFLAGMRKGVIPLETAVSSTSDPTEKRAKELNERALLHVAGTRAMSGLYVTWSGVASEYISV